MSEMTLGQRAWIKKMKAKSRLRQCPKCGNYTFYIVVTELEGISVLICARCGQEY
jgi:transcription elongation factor Elf1